MIEKKNYSQQIFDYIFEEIKEKRMNPGDKLPNERVLAETLGVSRPSLREALTALSQIGLITTKHGEGTYINNYNSDFLRSILKYLPLIDDELVYDLIYVRKILEAEAAGLAAINACESDCLQIEELLYEREALVHKSKPYFDPVRADLNLLDYKFHITVAKASQNKIFVEFINSIRNALSVHQKTASIKLNMPEKVNMQHRKIFEAIKQKNSVLAGNCMREHLQTVEDTMKEACKKNV